jgi:hypothetical protein
MYVDFQDRQGVKLTPDTGKLSLQVLRRGPTPVVQDLPDVKAAADVGSVDFVDAVDVPLAPTEEEVDDRRRAAALRSHEIVKAKQQLKKHLKDLAKAEEVQTRALAAAQATGNALPASVALSHQKKLDGIGVRVAAAQDAVSALEAEEKAEINAQISAIFDHPLSVLLRSVHLGDRAVHDASLDALLSWVRGYSEHRLKELLRLTRVPLGLVAVSWGLLALPGRMTELKSRYVYFRAPRVNLNDIAYADKAREAARQARWKLIQERREAEDAAATAKAAGDVAPVDPADGFGLSASGFALGSKKDPSFMQLDADPDGPLVPGTAAFRRRLSGMQTTVAERIADVSEVNDDYKKDIVAKKKAKKTGKSRTTGVDHDDEDLRLLEEGFAAPPSSRHGPRGQAGNSREVVGSKRPTSALPKKTYWRPPPSKKSNGGKGGYDNGHGAPASRGPPARRGR